MRIWLDDRPGALGAVASRIGSVKGDLVGIEILERGANRAIDELIVEVPSPALLELLVREVHEVDGVDVEDVREWHHGEHDIRLEPLEITSRMLESSSEADLTGVLVTRLSEMFELTYAAVVCVEDDSVVATAGQVPQSSWLLAFTKGGTLRSQLEGVTDGSTEVMLHGLDFSGWTLIASREARPFRALERSQVWMLCRIAGRYGSHLRSLDQLRQL